mgnify:CR=1 FL=1
MHPIAQIRQIRIGQPENFARNQQSAINKQPVSGKIAVTPSGLAGDSVGDPRFHGGAGEVAAGDEVFLLSRPFPEWSVARVLALIDSRCCDADEMRAVLRLPLPESWARLFARRLETGGCEDWDRRLFGDGSDGKKAA